MPEERLELKVEALAYGGDGVARDADGRTVFVRGGCPGDFVLARVVESRPRFARAEVAEILEPSSGRVEPVCPCVGRCGGCHWQHVSYSLQASSKTAIVRDALERIGGLHDVDVAETVPAASQLGYRNRIELVPGDGPIALGYHDAAGDHVPVKTCDLIAPSQRNAPERLSGVLRFLQGNDDLGIVRVGLRVSDRGGSTAVDIWTRPGRLPRGLAGRAIADAIGADSVARVLVRPERGPRSIRGVETLESRPAWTEHMAGFEWEVSPPSFFQVNTAQAESLVSLVLDALSVEPGDTVLDAFSGVGTFSLPLARAGSDVTCIESSKWALGDLRANLERAGLGASVIGGDVSRTLEEGAAFDKAVVDPPRAGLTVETADSIASSGIQRLVYVSCDPATFARDSRRLHDVGMRLTNVTPVDLFPQTYHVEVVGIFERA